MTLVLAADVMWLRVWLVWMAFLAVAVVALLWTRVAAGSLLDEDHEDLQLVPYDGPLTITGGDDGAAG